MKKFILPLFPLILLTGCNDEHSEKQNVLKKEAIIDAKNASVEVHESYLNCYALNYHDKRKCVSNLSEKYLTGDKLASIHYKTAFQYEAEKQGFIYFLQKSNVVCNSLEKSPKYLDENKAYIAQCESNNFYFVRFDSVVGKWMLVL